jgi:hypothetical protein
VIGVLPRHFYVPWQYIDGAKPDIVTPAASRPRWYRVTTGARNAARVDPATALYCE